MKLGEFDELKAAKPLAQEEGTAGVVGDKRPVSRTVLMGTALVIALALIFGAAFVLNKGAPPATTPTPSGGTPVPSATGVEMTWADVFGCAIPGITYSYARGNRTPTMLEADLHYSTGDAGTVNGTEAILEVLNVTFEAGANNVTQYTYMWRAKSGCRCLKYETWDSYNRQTLDVPCPGPENGGGEPEGVQTEFTSYGREEVSVPGYTGPAEKIRVLTRSNGEPAELFAWKAEGIPVPVKLAISSGTLELISYSPGAAQPPLPPGTPPAAGTPEPTSTPSLNIVYIYGCGLVFDRPANYVMLSDVNATETCITVQPGGSGSTIDCNGHALMGSSSGDKWGVRIEDAANVTVTDCTISNFYEGILITQGSSGTRLLNNYIHGTGGAGVRDGGAGTYFAFNKACGNGVSGTGNFACGSSAVDGGDNVCNPAGLTCNTRLRCGPGC